MFVYYNDKRIQKKQCHFSIFEKETPTRRVCPNCGNEAEGDELFCIKCGTKIS